MFDFAQQETWSLFYYHPEKKSSFIILNLSRERGLVHSFCLIQKTYLECEK